MRRMVIACMIAIRQVGRSPSLPFACIAKHIQFNESVKASTAVLQPPSSLSAIVFQEGRPSSFPIPKSACILEETGCDVSQA
jgi:hypothetical protein